MAKKKLDSSVEIPVMNASVLAVEEPRPMLYGDASAVNAVNAVSGLSAEGLSAEGSSTVEETFAILKFLGGENGFDVDKPGTLVYRKRPLTGTGTFKMQFRGVTMWIDDSRPDAVVTYLHNATASELTVECNDDFAIVANFRSGDLGIQVPRVPTKAHRSPLINRGEADETFGTPRSRQRRRMPAP